MSKGRLLAAVMTIAGCGDNGLAPLTHSGARLHLVAYELADGSRTIDPHVLYDSDRNEDCTVELFASGERHCMPATAGGTTFFDEDSCNRVIAAAPAGAEPPRYFLRRFLLSGVELPSRLYEAGPPVATPRFVWRQYDQYCLGPYVPEATLAFYSVGPVIEASELARVRAVETLDAGRLSLAIDESDDGLRRPGAYHDDELDLPCSLLPTANDIGRCVPTGVRQTTYFADAGCSAPLVVATPTLHHAQRTGCWDVVTSSGPPHTGVIYEQLGEDCVIVPAPSGPLYGAATSLHVAELARDRVTGGRLEETYLGGFRAPVLDGLAYDSTLDGDCAITSYGDDLACVPAESLPVRMFFSDAGCITPIEVAFVPTGECEPRHAYAGGRRIEGLYPGTLYELTTGDRCAAYVPPGRFEVRALGAAAMDLVTATRVID